MYISKTTFKTITPVSHNRIRFDHEGELVKLLAASLAVSNAIPCAWHFPLLPLCPLPISSAPGSAFPQRSFLSPTQTKLYSLSLHITYPNFKQIRRNH
jgi:hypothetical protein